MEEEIYTTEIDSDCLNQDIDDIDLYGEKLIDDDYDYDDCNINFE